jgi:hypothetical protein
VYAPLLERVGPDASHAVIAARRLGRICFGDEYITRSLEASKDIALASHSPRPSGAVPRCVVPCQFLATGTIHCRNSARFATLLNEN